MTIPTPNQKEVSTFIATISDPIQRADTEKLVEVIAEITGKEPALWGKIIGFGHYHYKYESGREGDSMKIGLAARKQALTLYGVIFYGKNTEQLTDLGKCSTGKGCLYIKRLSDIDLDVLKGMIKTAYSQ